MTIEIELNDAEYEKMLEYCEGGEEELEVKLRDWLTSGFLIDVFGGVMVPVITNPMNQKPDLESAMIEGFNPYRHKRDEEAGNVFYGLSGGATTPTNGQANDTNGEPINEPSNEPINEPIKKNAPMDQVGPAPKKQGLTIHKK